MRLQLQKYMLEVIYKPGKYLYIADALSRNFNNNNNQNDNQDADEI